jgi:hypothetical protein
VKHEIFLPALKPEDLPSRLTKWLDEREAMGTPTDVASRLLFFPFWVHATRDQETLVPGAALLADGLASFKLPAGDAKSFGPDFTRLGTVLPATVARESTPFGGAPASDLRLVHVPFFEISFRLFRKTVRVWMDAVSGQVLPLDPVPTSGPGEAAALLPVRTPADLAGDVAWQKLVSLPCRVNGDVLDEPVSGFSIRIAQVLPRPSFA